MDANRRSLLLASVTGLVLLGPWAWGQPDKAGPPAPADARKFPCPDGLFGMSFSSDGRWLAASTAKSVIAWDAATGKQLLRCQEPRSWFTAVCRFSPDGKLLATGSDDGSVMLWDTATGKNVRTIPGHPYPVIAVSFQSDGKHLVSVSGIRPWLSPQIGGEVKLWDTANGKVLRSFKIPSHDLGRVAFRPDGKNFAGVGFDNLLRVWDVNNGKQLFAGPGDRNVCFSPDGRSLAAPGEKGTSIVVWETLTGKVRLRLQAALAGYYQLLFSPDGKHLAALTLDARENAAVQERPAGVVLTVWNLLSGEVTHTERHARPVLVAFRPCSSDIAIGSDRSIVLSKTRGE